MLLDLTSDYMRFLNTKSLQEKRDKYAKMNEAMAAAGKEKR
jgi:lambda repressor-like predicted transcriptional regulator